MANPYFQHLKSMAEKKAAAQESIKNPFSSCAELEAAKQVIAGEEPSDSVFIPKDSIHEQLGGYELTVQKVTSDGYCMCIDQSGNARTVTKTEILSQKLTDPNKSTKDFVPEDSDIFGYGKVGSI